MKIAEIARKPGDELPNGATLLKEVMTGETDYTDTGHQRRESLVLAIQPGLAFPFISWSRWVTYNSDKTVLVDDTAWGNYHMTLDQALAEFNLRVENKTERQWAYTSKPWTFADGS